MKTLYITFLSISLSISRTLMDELLLHKFRHLLVMNDHLHNLTHRLLNISKHKQYHQLLQYVLMVGNPSFVSKLLLDLVSFALFHITSEYRLYLVEQHSLEYYSDHNLGPFDELELSCHLLKLHRLQNV